MAGAGLLLVDRGMRLFRATACLAR